MQSKTEVDSLVHYMESNKTLYEKLEVVVVASALDDM